MRVVIIGGTGHVGTFLVPRLVMAGHEVNPTLVIAATLGGGVFGDHCSPISDTTIISSMASATDHIDHVKTQPPYALIGGAITTIMFLIIGIMST
jgi:tetracycline resistance efflux pump